MRRTRDRGRLRSAVAARDSVARGRAGAPRLYLYWEDGEGKPSHQTLITVTFAERGDKTELTLRQGAFETVEARNTHHRGWTSTLQRFAEYLAENR